MNELLQSTAFGAALVFGFRHGFDWDHIAALTDLTGSQATSRRSMWLATLYALGHAAMVNLIGTAPDPAALLGLPGVHLHDYGKAPRPGRKLGHCTLVARTARQRDRVLAQLTLRLRR